MAHDPDYQPEAIRMTEEDAAADREAFRPGNMNTVRTAKESEAYFSGYERVPLTADEVALLGWNEEQFSEVADKLR